MLSDFFRIRTQNKKNKPGAYLIGLLLTATLGSCLFLSPVSAAVIYQADKTLSSGSLTGSQMTVQMQYFTNPPETSPTSTITDITINAKFDNACTIRLRPKNVAGTVFTSANLVATAGVQQDYTFSITTSTNLHTGNLRSWSIDFGSGGGGTCTLTSQLSGEIYGSATSLSYPNGFWSLDGSTFQNGALANEFFIINGSGAIPPTIEWKDDSIYETCDFNVWPTVFSDPGHALVNPPFTDHTQSIVVSWGPYISATNPQLGQNRLDVQGCVPIDSDNNDWGAYFSTSTNGRFYCSDYGVVKSEDLAEGQLYVATAYLLNVPYTATNTTDLSWAYTSSSNWVFGIQGPNAAIGCLPGVKVPYPSGTWAVNTSTSDNANLNSILASDWCADLTTATAWYDIKDHVVTGFCYVMQKIFKPSQSSIQNFSTLYGEIRNKPPFGYLTVYGEVLTSLQNASSTTSTPLVDNQLVSTTVWSSIAAIPFMVYLDDIFVWVIWVVGLGFYAWHRFKNFEF